MRMLAMSTSPDLLRAATRGLSEALASSWGFAESEAIVREDLGAEKIQSSHPEGVRTRSTAGVGRARRGRASRA